MDVEPIYCAEQIVVPVDLADVLKAFTKEVIRRQPENLVEFGAKYFRNLASVAAGATPDVTAPSREQLQALHQRAEGSKTCTVQQMEALCSHAGIAPGVITRVVEAGRFDTGEVVVDKFLFLLLAMSCDSFASVIQGVFDLFGKELESTRFVELISYLAPDMDPEITSQFLADLSARLDRVPVVTYSSVILLECLQEKLQL